MRIGTLVRVISGKGTFQGKILAWYEDFSGPHPGINAKIFEATELYGLYMGPWEMERVNADWFVKVFLENRTYIFNFDEIEEAEYPDPPSSASEKTTPAK